MKLPLALILLLPLLACAADEPDVELIGPPRTGRDYVPPALRDLGRANKIRVVYFIPEDRQPASRYQEKFETLLAFVADVYRRDLQAKGHHCPGLDFEFERGRLRVNVIRGQHPAAHYNNAPNYDGMRTWKSVLQEVEPAVGPAGRNLLLILTETYDQGPWRFEWPGTFALGAHYTATGGAGMFCAWNLRDEFCATTREGQVKLLADATPIEGRTALGSGRPDSPRYEFIEDGIGAIVHELGHVLGLSHDHRRDQSFIMGNGFRSFRVNYVGSEAARPVMCFSTVDARLLAASRFLCNVKDPRDSRPPVIKLDLPQTLPAGTKQIQISGRVEDDRGLIASCYYISQGDSVRGGGALSGTASSLQAVLDVPPLTRGEVRLELTVVDVGGNIARAVHRFKVE